MDAVGNAYGVTAYGGYNDSGTVFQLSPTSGFHVIYAFHGPDGSNPMGNLIFDSLGNLYGTTGNGGTSANCTLKYGCGVVFKLSPPTNGNVWTETTIYNFGGGSDGSNPYSGVTSDSAGNFYGSAATGGTFQCGVIFELSPSGPDQWIQNALYEFADDGCEPWGGLTFDTAGSLYGTTSGGGTWGIGMVFQLVPSPNGIWSFNSIHEFNPNTKDGAAPLAGLITDAADRLYGTTSGGGTAGYGTVFELTQNQGTWTESIIHVFAGGDTDGADPRSSLVLDKNGNLYGTTWAGGAPPSPGYGTVFMLTPGQGDNWTERHFSFGTGVHGGQPTAPPFLDGAGHIYGTTHAGGQAKNGGIADGVVFRLSVVGPN